MFAACFFSMDDGLLLKYDIDSSITNERMEPVRYSSKMFGLIWANGEKVLVIAPTPHTTSNAFVPSRTAVETDF